jgi:hypothetical protein
MVDRSQAPVSVLHSLHLHAKALDARVKEHATTRLEMVRRLLQSLYPIPHIGVLVQRSPRQKQLPQSR